MVNQVSAFVFLCSVNKLVLWMGYLPAHSVGMLVYFY